MARDKLPFQISIFLDHKLTKENNSRYIVFPFPPISILYLDFFFSSRAIFSLVVWIAYIISRGRNKCINGDPKPRSIISNSLGGQTFSMWSRLKPPLRYLGVPYLALLLFQSSQTSYIVAGYWERTCQWVKAEIVALLRSSLSSYMRSPHHILFIQLGQRPAQFERERKIDYFSVLGVANVCIHI